MRRGSHPFPGKPSGAASPTPRKTLRQYPSPGQSPAERSRPLPTDRTIDGCLRKPPGRACPAPTVRRSGNGCPRKPRGRFHIPIRRAGCPHPAAASRRRRHPGRDESLHYNPCLPPWGKVAPQGRMRGRLPLPPIPGQTVGAASPTPRETFRQRPSPGQPPANIRPRKPAGRACPAPTVQRNDQFYTTQKGGSHT